ncbi:hypothetical protein UFOVP1419_49 [uncultured Caudovirales phage]|uniref:Uncharacterized protein n=1 Tax=uncultured Caudovirales phage TaxID=2100421 RepID=A0A6J5SE58_9CAUD|nr:hypothetical protein UFOVP1419_49 [uncultured Caudovirales phage]
MAIDDSRMPNGSVAGRDLKDAGNKTGVTDTYGAGDALNTGYTSGGSIAGSTKSDTGCMPGGKC